MATIAHSTATPFDIGRAQAFMQKAMGDFSSTMVGLACAVGDRLGFFRLLAEAGPLTAGELARTTATDARLVATWLSTMASTGYLDYDAKTGQFALPTEHASLLVESHGSMCLAGGFQLLLGFAQSLSQLIESFRTCGGIPQSAYTHNVRDGMERMSAPWFEQLLVSQWLPLLPAVLEGLRKGIRVADIGCGAGRALAALASAFPASSFTGYDIFASALERARENAAELGLTPQIRFVERNVEDGIPESFDFITTFNSLHDMTDRYAAARAIRGALSPDGLWLILESSFSDRIEDNTGPMGTILYGTSLFYNAPVSIADGGNGSGALLPEHRIREVCEAASFDVRRLPVTNPMHALYVANPL